MLNHRMQHRVTFLLEMILNKDNFDKPSIHQFRLGAIQVNYRVKYNELSDQRGRERREETYQLVEAYEYRSQLNVFSASIQKVPSPALFRFNCTGSGVTQDVKVSTPILSMIE